ncbi:hypothetical protein V6N13_088564 [Hibiscus sabdariffa]
MTSSNLWFSSNGVATATSSVDWASCGGVLHDHNGHRIRGFTKFIGRCSVVHTELWGIATSMELAWLLGCRHLIVESDSVDAVMHCECSNTGLPKEVANRNNRWRNQLARLASNISFDIVTFDEPPPEVVPSLNVVL